MTPLDPALLAAIVAEPADDGVRLAASDWWEEQGELARAEFVRVQIKRAEYKDEPECARCNEDIFGNDLDLHCADPECPYNVWRSLLYREHQLLDAHGADWVRADRGMLPGAPVERNAWMYRSLPSMHPYRYWLGYHRGFLGAFDGPAEDWLAHADALTAAHPIQRVTLTTWPGFEPFPPEPVTLPEMEFWSDNVRFQGRARIHKVPSGVCGEIISHCLAAEWPRITFTLPEEAT